MTFEKIMVAVVLVLGSGVFAEDGHEGHDHSAHVVEPVEVVDPHAGHDHGAHEDESGAIALSAAEIAAIGLQTAVAGPGVLGQEIQLAGEIRLNQERISHLVPAVSGLVRDAGRTLGETVKAGDVLAWLESAELGQLKMDYLGDWTELSCCALDLTRAQQIHDNTTKLLEVLAGSPKLDALQTVEGIEMGENLSKLVSAYAEVSLAQATYEREKPLFEQKISSEGEFLAAQNGYKKANAEYVALRDSIAFEVKRNLLEANQERRIRTMAAKNSERQLKILGMTAANVKELEALANYQTAPEAKAKVDEDCSDPDCTECVLASRATQEDKVLAAAEAKLAWYPLLAPFDGTIIEKHIVLGERVGPESRVYVLADLSSVWVELQVYPKDLRFVKAGQSVVISTGSVTDDARGVIGYVGPVVGTESRTVLARVVLDNASGAFRPGLFVTATVVAGKTQAKVVVARDAVQSLEGRKCVFVKGAHGFEPVFVVLGEMAGGQVEILSGLNVGQEYVTDGAFALKSQIITSTLDSHAGHGH